MSRIFYPDDDPIRFRKIRAHSPAPPGRVCRACPKGEERPARYRVAVQELVGSREGGRLEVTEGRRGLVCVCDYHFRQAHNRFWDRFLPI